MRAIIGRVNKLELRFGVGGPSRYEMMVWELVETLRSRRAARSGIPFVPRRWEDREPSRYSSVEEALRAGRNLK